MSARNRQFSDIRHQHGQLYSGTVFGLLLCAVLLTFIIKLFPVYVDHNFVTSTVQSMLDHNGMATMSESQILQDLESSLRLNNVRNFDVDNVAVYRDGNATVVHIRYQKRVALVGNIDLLVSFDEVLR